MTVKPRIGMWLIGARGGVASTTIVGLIALKKGLVQSQGLVSQLPQFAHLPLPAWGDLVVGGHEIRCLPLRGEALRLATEMRVVSPDLIAQCGDELDEIDGRIRPGTSMAWAPRSRPWPMRICPVMKRRKPPSSVSNATCASFPGGMPWST